MKDKAKAFLRCGIDTVLFPGYVYMITCGSEWVKVGETLDIQKRLKGYANPNEQLMIAWPDLEPRKTQDWIVESFVAANFRRHRREYFQVPNHILGFFLNLDDMEFSQFIYECGGNVATFQRICNPSVEEERDWKCLHLEASGYAHTIKCRGQRKPFPFEIEEAFKKDPTIFGTLRFQFKALSELDAMLKRITGSDETLDYSI